MFFEENNSCSGSGMSTGFVFMFNEPGLGQTRGAKGGPYPY